MLTSWFLVRIILYHSNFPLAEKHLFIHLFIKISLGPGQAAQPAAASPWGAQGVGLITGRRWMVVGQRTDVSLPPPKINKSTKNKSYKTKQPLVFVLWLQCTQIFLRIINKVWKVLICSLGCFFFFFLFPLVLDISRLQLRPDSLWRKDEWRVVEGSAAFSALGPDASAHREAHSWGDGPWTDSTVHFTRHRGSGKNYLAERKLFCCTFINFLLLFRIVFRNRVIIKQLVVSYKKNRTNEKDASDRKNRKDWKPPFSKWNYFRNL